MPSINRLMELLFGCWHSNLSRVFTIGKRTYCVCCDCGAEFEYSLQTMSITREQPRHVAHPVYREA